MDAPLLDAIGAGLAAMAAGSGYPIPKSGYERGGEMIRALAAEPDGPRAIDLCRRLATDYAALIAGLDQPDDVLARHLAVLPRLLETCRIPDLIGAQVAAAAHAAPETRASGAGLLAKATIMQARAAGVFGDGQLSEPLASRLLERLHLTLLDACAEIEPLLPAIATSLAALVPAKPEAEPPPASAPAPPAIDEAALREALAPLVAALPDPEGAAEQSLEQCSQLVAELRLPLSDGSPNDALRREAADHLAAANLVVADQCLAQAEDNALHAAQTDLPNVTTHLAMASRIRVARAGIDEVRHDYRHAARHYHAASRCLPIADQLGRSRLGLRQAMLLMRQGDVAGDDEALAEAVTRFTEASTADLARGAPQEWTAVQLALARLQSMIGAREQNADRYLRAAEHARAVLTAYGVDATAAQRVAVQLTLGEALYGYGDLAQGAAHLAEAAETYEAAQSLSAGERPTPAWVVATAGLGLARIRLGEIGCNADECEEGLVNVDAALEAAWPADAELDHARLQAARGCALLILYARRSDETLSRAAAEAFEAAIAACDPVREARQRTALRHRLALTLWAQGSRTADAGLLRRAGKLLAAVRDDHDGAGDATQAAEVRHTIGELQDELAVLARPPEPVAPPSLGPALPEPPPLLSDAASPALAVVPPSPPPVPTPAEPAPALPALPPPLPIAS